MKTDTSKNEIVNRVTVSSLLLREDYRKRFEEVLKDNAGPFMASLIQVSRDSKLADADPKSVIAAAMVAASLKLPIDKNLGFAHIVAYAGLAQFQLGYKGFIQLALRTGQYSRINATPVNAEAFMGYDEVGEPIIDWGKLDETKEAVGYVAAWKLVNGFTKIIYWTKEKVEAHSKRYSQAVKKKKQDSPWFTNFDAMALKTVIKNGLSKWGILSVDMQKAIVHDQSAQRDIDAEVLSSDYIDNQKEIEVKKPLLVKSEPAPEEPKTEAPAPAAPAPATPAPAPAEPVKEPESTVGLTPMEAFCKKEGIKIEDARKYFEFSGYKTFESVPEAYLNATMKNPSLFKKAIKDVLENTNKK